MDLSTRSSDPEIMDDLQCAGETLEQTLRELEFINKWLGGNAVTVDALSKLLSGRDRGRTYSVADLGCGGGDMCVHAVRWASGAGFHLQVIGIDANQNVIAFAERNTAGTPNVSFRCMDVFSDEFRSLHFDIVMATLFYHHFNREQLIAFFTGLSKSVGTGIVINDIHRHSLAYHSIRLLTKWFSRSSMVKYDAPLSVRRAFNRSELDDILRASGFRNYRIRWRWAFRWQVIATID